LDGLGGELKLVLGLTDSGRFDHVADSESLYRLVLWGAARAVGAADRVDMSASVLVSTVGGTLLDHFGGIIFGD